MSAISTIDNFYALAVISGREQSTRKKILDRLERNNLLTTDMEFICPDEEVVLHRGAGEARQTARRLTLPGYILFRSRRLRGPAVGCITAVPGVLSFLGGDEPQRLRPEEVDRILGASSKPGVAVKAAWEVGALVTVIEGPLSDFTGKVVAANDGRQEATVEIEIFGRATPTTVPFRALKRMR